jgi:hypothetical protein
MAPFYRMTLYTPEALNRKGRCACRQMQNASFCLWRHYGTNLLMTTVHDNPTTLSELVVETRVGKVSLEQRRPNGRRNPRSVTEAYRIQETSVVCCSYRAVRRAGQVENGVATTLDWLQWAAEMSRSARHPPAVSQPRSGHGMVREHGRAVSAGTAWDEVQHAGRARILDLRSRFERAVWGYPLGSQKVSFLAHALRPDLNAIYLCQHALRSNWPRDNGARETENGFRGWVDAGLPIRRRSLRGACEAPDDKLPC